VRRVLVTAVSAISLVLCVGCLSTALARLTWDAGPNMYWDRGAQQWRPESLATVRTQRLTSIALTPVTLCSGIP
jgi:hypothetical protein